MGVEPTCPDWKSGTFAARPRAHVLFSAAEGERFELSRRIARPLSRRLPSPIGLSFRSQEAAEAGIEPASKRLTVALPCQHRTLRNVDFKGVWLEFTCQFNISPHLEAQSVQRESNPHFSHGKAVGYRYIMDACVVNQLSKSMRAPGGG